MRKKATSWGKMNLQAAGPESAHLLTPELGLLLLLHSRFLVMVLFSTDAPCLLDHGGIPNDVYWH